MSEQRKEWYPDALLTVAMFFLGGASMAFSHGLVYLIGDDPSKVSIQDVGIAVMCMLLTATFFIKAGIFAHRLVLAVRHNRRLKL